ncbi:MAG: P1 family peptidase, partial [Candidatus Dormiibacterota bacterium]
MSFADMLGVRVGHYTEVVARTGCTVLLLGEEGAVCGVRVGGGAPGTRETDGLEPGRAVERVHAICLSGGSAFGLSSADGVMRYLAERGIGFPVAGLRVPIVPSAIIFDLLEGTPTAPGPDGGYAACVIAERAEGEPAEGQVGAGTGATIGKLLGFDRRVPGGVGVASVPLPGGGVVGALVVVNAVGDVVDETGRIVAGCGGWQA